MAVIHPLPMAPAAVPSARAHRGPTRPLVKVLDLGLGRVVARLLGALMRQGLARPI